MLEDGFQYALELSMYPKSVGHPCFVLIYQNYNSEYLALKAHFAVCTGAEQPGRSIVADADGYVPVRRNSREYAVCPSSLAISVQKACRGIPRANARLSGTAGHVAVLTTSYSNKRKHSSSSGGALPQPQESTHG